MGVVAAATELRSREARAGWMQDAWRCAARTEHGISCCSLPTVGAPRANGDTSVRAAGLFEGVLVSCADLPLTQVSTRRQLLVQDGSRRASCAVSLYGRERLLLVRWSPALRRRSLAWELHMDLGRSVKDVRLLSAVHGVHGWCRATWGLWQPGALGAWVLCAERSVSARSARWCVVWGCVVGVWGLDVDVCGLVAR